MDWPTTYRLHQAADILWRLDAEIADGIRELDWARAIIAKLAHDLANEKAITQELRSEAEEIESALIEDGQGYCRTCKRVKFYADMAEPSQCHDCTDAIDVPDPRAEPEWKTEGPGGLR